jgi:hypothetical protein
VNFALRFWSRPHHTHGQAVPRRPWPRYKYPYVKADASHVNKKQCCVPDFRTSKDPHADHVALPLAPVGGLCHRIRPPAPDAVKATVIPAKAGIQASSILDPGLRRGDGVSDDSLPRLQEIYRQSLWTLTTSTARGFPERTKATVGPASCRSLSDCLDGNHESSPAFCGNSRVPAFAGTTDEQCAHGGGSIEDQSDKNSGNDSFAPPVTE